MTQQHSLNAAATQRYSLLPVAADSHLARLMLAFLATAGLFYVNIMPALVSGLIDGRGFTARDAGVIGSCNVYGAAVGAFIAIFLVKKLPWKTASAALLLLLISLDLVSMLLTNPLPMMLLRAVHGLTGGLLVGIAFAVMARCGQVHKAFGMLLLVQFGLGGLGVMLLPPLVPVYGSWVLFMALIAFSLSALLMLAFLPTYPLLPVSTQHSNAGLQYRPLLAAILAVFLFQAANMALYAYIIELGEQAGLSLSIISPALGVSAWLGLLGSVLVIWLSTRFGRALPVFISIVITAVATYALHFSASAGIFWLANLAVGITWAFSIAYLLGVCAEFDQAGQMAALGGFASKMGLASGPLFAALVIDGGSYSGLINIAVVLLILAAIVALYPCRKLDNVAG
ncbi:MAG TPA: MFS transporter [Rheinheimera sp.]|nr:MFS transporter [Rheinheimera sp.]